jgi:hypothetical protein
VGGGGYSHAVFLGLLLCNNVQPVLRQKEPKPKESGVMQPFIAIVFAKLVPGLVFRCAGILLLYPGSFPVQ